VPSRWDVASEDLALSQSLISVDVPGREQVQFMSGG